MSFDAKQSEQPDFTAFYPFIGWGIDFSLPLDLDWYNGARLGSYLMSFDITGLNKDEQELGLGFHSRLAYPLGSSWSLDVSARYTVMYTHERIRLFDLAAGVSRSFGMPGWLKDFLE